MDRCQKVISLKLAKEIDGFHKKLGIEVESEWWWRGYAFGNDWEYLLQDKKPEYTMFEIGLEQRYYPAYDTSELGEELKKCFPNDTRIVILTKRNTYDIDQLADHYADRKTNLAQLLGRRYLWLLQNGYIKGV